MGSDCGFVEFVLCYLGHNCLSRLALFRSFGIANQLLNRDAGSIRELPQHPDTRVFRNSAPQSKSIAVRSE